MNLSKVLKIVEFLLLFIVVPGILAIPIAKPIKLTSVILALIYVCYLTYKNKVKFNFKSIFKRPTRAYLIRILVIAVLLIVIGVVIIQFINPQLLFSVVKQKPFVWLAILFVYAFLSVIPQELIYRGFFYSRYYYLFPNKKIFSILNVVCFSWCHVFLGNIWVMVITALAGVFFVYTYEKEKSLLWTVVEHSLYGNLVFTLGLGEMLAFPA